MTIGMMIEMTLIVEKNSPSPATVTCVCAYRSTPYGARALMIKWLGGYRS
jgi:hypothetical protein